MSGTYTCEEGIKGCPDTKKKYGQRYKGRKQQEIFGKLGFSRPEESGMNGQWEVMRLRFGSEFCMGKEEDVVT